MMGPSAFFECREHEGLFGFFCGVEGGSSDHKPALRGATRCNWLRFHTSAWDAVFLRQNRLGRERLSFRIGPLPKSCTVAFFAFPPL